MKPRCFLHDRLATQRTLVGLLQTQTNPTFTEMAGMCGYDFLMLNGEHGVFSESDWRHTLQVLAATDVFVLVRLAIHDLQAAGWYMDMGAVS